jgi:hypothetical protein
MPLGLGRGQQTTTTVQVAGGTDRSVAVLVLGGGLIVVNFVFGPGSAAVAYWFGNKQSGAAIPTIKLSAYYPLQFLALFLLILLAKFGGEVGGNLAVLLLAAIWVVWLLNKPDAVAKLLGQAFSSSSSTSSTSSTSKTSGATK